MVYFVARQPFVAAVLGGVLAFSFVLQCATSLALGQPLWIGLTGLIGMKPAIEAWRDATGAGPFKGQNLDNSQMMFICRGTEMVVRQ
jgi:hypothetical protein